MRKETSPQSKIELEIKQKRELLEETLTAKMSSVEIAAKISQSNLTN